MAGDPVDSVQAFSLLIPLRLLDWYTELPWTRIKRFYRLRTTLTSYYFAFTQHYTVLTGAFNANNLPTYLSSVIFGP